ncbi:MAG: simple sugar transport system ATP-binding protein [Halanaerobium sp. 4-GBenrich]|jgi:simple sugar transport system ATP-binding protein|uniref:Nucleoside ABC transporter ATP-binding protein n=1 Tax=Halanaerobium congolense TaxID=54121 RepID=A0A1G6P3Z9_9FIRM|nr:ABC transporter ATP-binding protein [Halanaerobium congolense]KXS50333.1 MAG: simple sugar transport system ATP-binding protein [Halanaerobium sp. T82-1]ODS49652.1 MAG: simple sugar transport system ATP-binding protein [Halanaerobium sp. 4-GBenrich]OEG62875.1 MAG: ABC transporter ATP-binding protein [Halanaerobium sp. MDAL1]TDP11531.1 nucleoside ABC transporter ATP-binding protein [Halanaerobium congolense]SDC74779.1 nucleoside ABC transporter ATP-binding protein [Halanaerobium congolense]
MAREDNYILDMQNITKIFPGVKANDNVNLSIKKGEIHALVGENGAGKTTLMNVLYGLYDPEGGQVFYEGNKVNVDGPQDAIDLGIGMVHQHFMLVDPLTVTENIILGNEPRKGLKINQKKARKEVEDISNKYGLYVDPDAKIQDISVGMQQRVEIIKTLYRGADLLIFDEPTAVLTPQEIDELFDIFRSLKEQGKTIIFITHKLQEVKEISDRITVLRGGKSIDTVDTANVSEEDVAELMVGRPVLLEVEKDKAKPGKDFLTIENLKVKNNRNIQAVNGVSLTVKKGEILGIAGVEGNGQSELIEAITGLRKIESGKVKIKDKEITKFNAREIKREGVAHIPEDRQKRGLIMDFDLQENMILGYHDLEPFSKNGIMNYNNIRNYTQELLEKFDVRGGGATTDAKSLSGGNQQKVIVAREFSHDPELLIASQPTRGVDVGSIEFIHKQIIDRRDNGAAVLLVSAELSEILSLSDRIAVIFEGEIVDILDVEDADERKLGNLMTGSKADAGGESIE